MVHPMQLPEDRHLMVDETMHQIFNERPEHHSAHSREPQTWVQGKGAAVDIVEQQSTDNEWIDIQLGIVTDLGTVHAHTTQHFGKILLAPPAATLATARASVYGRRALDLRSCLLGLSQWARITPGLPHTLVMTRVYPRQRLLYGAAISPFSFPQETSLGLDRLRQRIVRAAFGGQGVDTRPRLPVRRRHLRGRGGAGWQAG